MTRLQQLIFLKQYESIQLAIQFGKLNETKMAKALTLKAEIEKRLGL